MFSTSTDRKYYVFDWNVSRIQNALNKKKKEKKGDIWPCQSSICEKSKADMHATIYGWHIRNENTPKALDLIEYKEVSSIKGHAASSWTVHLSFHITDDERMLLILHQLVLFFFFPLNFLLWLFRLACVNTRFYIIHFEKVSILWWLSTGSFCSNASKLSTRNEKKNVLQQHWKRQQAHYQSCAKLFWDFL